MLSAVEKNLLKDNPSELFESERGRALFKAMANFIIPRCTQGKRLERFSEDVFSNRKLLEEASSELINIILLNEANIKTYTTGEVAEYIGVSIQTIHDWIKSGKLVGATRGGEQQQWRIPETAIVKGLKGKTVDLKTIITEVNQVQDDNKISREIEIKIIQEELKYFQDKYETAEVLMDKKDKTDLENRDLQEWTYLNNRLKSLGDN